MGNCMRSLREALRRRRVLVAILGAAVFAPAAVAQDEDADDETAGEVEEVVVTGSLLKRDNFDSASPLQILDDVDILAEATPALGEIIYNQTFNYGSDAFASHYSVTNPEGNRTSANFRGLGGRATLSLLDGKRVTDSNLNNLIPQIAIRRIDILKDGASALYGSDAVAGVINIIPKKEYEGTEIGAFYTMDSKRDHGEYVVNMVHGGLTDRGYFTFAMEAREKTALYQTERPSISNRSISSSGTGNPGRYNVPIRSESGDFMRNDAGAIVRQTLPDPGCGVAESPGGNGADKVGNYRNNISGRLSGTVCRFEFGEFFNFVTPNKVVNAYLNFEHQVTDRLTYDGDFIYSRQKTRSRGSPTNPGGRIRDINLILGGVSGDHPGNPFTAFYDRNKNGAIDIGPEARELLYAMDANGDGVPDRNDDGQVILASDPFDPSMGIEFNEDVQIAALRLFGKLGTLPSNLDETGANLGYATYDIDAIRLTQNFTYQFDNGWEARFSAMRMQNKDVRFRKNGSFRAVLLGLQGELGPEPGVSDYANAFHWYNPFSTSALNCRYRVCTDPGAARNPNLGDYPNAQYVADTIDINAIRLLKTSLTSYDVLATGDLFEGWAGTIAGAFGAEYRSYKLNWDSRSDENQCNNWYDACNFDYSAKDTITSMFFELGVPILSSDTAGFAELQVAGRYSDYDGIGSTFDPKVAALYQPTTWLSLRASYSESFIAPSIPDRFDPGGSFLQSTNDPLFNDFEGTYRTNTTSGNPELRPETAQVYNLGFSMAFLDGDLNFGLDYSNYDFVDRITLLRGPRVVGADFTKFLAAFPQSACSSCQTGQSYDVNRDDALAWLSQQDPAIVRGGPPSYTIVEVQATRINANKMVHTAWDAYGSYKWRTDNMGVFNFRAQVTRIDEYSFDFGEGNTGDAVGLQNLGIDVIPPLPETSVIGTTTWTMGNSTALLRARWASEVDATWGSVLEALTYVDATYTYQASGWLGDASLTTLEAGVRNLMDEYPEPDGAFGAGIELALHDPRGRMFFGRVTHRF